MLPCMLLIKIACHISIWNVALPVDYQNSIYHMSKWKVTLHVKYENKMSKWNGELNVEYQNSLLDSRMEFWHEFDAIQEGDFHCGMITFPG